MYKSKKILALITARGKSKRLPRKNIKLFGGKPLIAWTINQAKKSRFIDRIIVSTDDKEIAEISRKYKADVPFLRPKKLATDNAKSIDVILHTLNWMKGHDKAYDIIILLQPTSPLRASEDIDKAVELLFQKDTKSIVSVCELDYSPFWVNTLPEDGCTKDFIKKGFINRNSQQLPKFYRLNGAVYLAYCDYIRKQKSFFGAESFAYLMPKERSIDIDDELDFRFAEFLIKNKKQIEHNINIAKKVNLKMTKRI